MQGSMGSRSNAIAKRQDLIRLINKKHIRLQELKWRDGSDRICITMLEILMINQNVRVIGCLCHNMTSTRQSYSDAMSLLVVHKGMQSDAPS